MALVSVVIPAYNAEEYLAEAIRSVLRQTYPRMEVLVVDDGSRDHTAAVVQELGEPVRYLSQEHAGPSVARNTGIAHSRGEYITFLDADDRFQPERLALLMDALRHASPAAAFATTEVCLWDGRHFLQRFGVSRPAAGERDLSAFLDDDRPYIGILARRDILEKAGGFRPDLWVNEDYDLWLRILAAGYTYAYIPEPLYLYRIYHQSLSRDPARRIRIACAVHQEAIRTLPCTWGQRRRLAYLLWRDRARLHAMVGREARTRGNLWEWGRQATAGAVCQGVRILLRPQFSFSRWHYKSSNGLGILEVVAPPPAR